MAIYRGWCSVGCGIVPGGCQNAVAKQEVSSRATVMCRLFPRQYLQKISQAIIHPHEPATSRFPTLILLFRNLLMPIEDERHL